ncbi:Hypothetical predicted protein, partial [Marmota monax]
MEHATGINRNEEQRYDCAGGETFINQQRYNEEIFWDFKINILGKKDDTPVHFCNKCELPIKIYGRMIPCKHAFCYACAVLHGNEGNRVCLDCGHPVRQVEKRVQGSVFVCSSVQECRRTYLSQRDLQ